MKVEQQSWELLVETALQSRGMRALRPVVEKELLHFDILFALDKGGFLDQLVFQGGTSLRLCYGANRFSEDLDFAGGRDFSSNQLLRISECIQDYIGARYGLEVSVKEPASLKAEAEYSELKIDKWQVSVTTSPQRRDIPRQKIKLEVANVPAYTKQPLPLLKNYDFLPDGYADTLVLTESLEEIMADKIISLPATRRYVRHRDIWDLVWLQQRNVQPSAEFVSRKISDYKLVNFSEYLDDLLQSLPNFVTNQGFFEEMRRFVPQDVYDRTLAKKKFLDYTTSTLVQLFERVRSDLAGQQGNAVEEPEFKM